MKKFIFSRFASLQAYSGKFYLQMNSFTGAFQHRFKQMLPPCSPHVLTQAPPPSNFEEPPNGWGDMYGTQPLPPPVCSQHLWETLVCVCVSVFPSIHCEGFTCLEQLECQGIDQRCCFEDATISAKPLHYYFRMKHRAFLTTHFIRFAP